MLEASAVEAYEFEADLITSPIGFITTDDGRYGCSPDRLVGEDGLVEIKCPAPQTHLGHLVDGFSGNYRPQVQGQLLVSERQWADWVSYSPEMPMVRIRAQRDEDYIRGLRAALDEFCDMKDDIECRARALGHFASRRRLETAAGALADYLAGF